jgi:GntR family transcriptional regulator
VGPGQAIPSEMDLAARFRVSQGTVRKAIDEMATENLLVRRQGKGTFVATHAEQATQYRFLRLVSDDGSAQRRCSAGCWTAAACAPRPRWPGCWG